MLSAVGPAARFHREEAFAPVVSVQPYTTELEAVEQANGTPYVALSGFGRLGGSEAWHFFTEQKTLYIHLDVC
ncbi:aldehyde dehydrogenase family protein [Nonomuraea sp. NPDC050556]|uniref:aldehyde dehydrogenase family protein n=1 Tax=Nonomuraea sp. NPDC050556 TaxID=3364369 RepID=UPI0037B7207B